MVNIILFTLSAHPHMLYYEGFQEFGNAINTKIHVLPHSGLISRDENFEVFADFLLSSKF